ncbi:enoyl-CoA hydratase/isomerase family [Seiridium cupressi]
MAATDKAPVLLASEQIGPKGWIRNMICLELAADYDADQIASILRTAWASFKARTPLVGVEAVPLGTDVKPAGLLKLQAYGDGEVEEFLVKDHRNDDTIPSFAQLKAQGFPNASMNSEKLCLRGRGGEWPTFGVDRLATNMMQANLINGGLLLNHLCFHAFGDGTSMWKLLELFAEDVRRAQGLAIERPAEIPIEDRAKLVRSTGKNVSANFAAEHTEFIHLPFTPDGLPDGLTKARHHAHVYRFSPEAIKSLKEECAPANVRVLKDQIPQDQLPKFISTNDALTALLWKSIQRAEHADHSTHVGKPTPSVVMVSMDTRRRAHVPVHPHTLGNIVGYAAAALPVSKLLSNEHTSLADLAVSVRLSVSKCGNTYFDEIAHYVENMDDVHRLAGTAFLDMPGNNVLQSSWSEFDYYGIEWGPAFGDKIKAVRFPAGGVCAGFQIIMPSPPNTPSGTVEVLVDVSDEGWPRLLRDETWNTYAQNPTTVAYE